MGRTIVSPHGRAEALDSLCHWRFFSRLEIGSQRKNVDRNKKRRIDTCLGQMQKAPALSPAAMHRLKWRPAGKAIFFQMI